MRSLQEQQKAKEQICVHFLRTNYYVKSKNQRQK